VEGATREAIANRFRRVRAQARRTVTESQQTTAAARATLEATAESRRRRWTLRYERVLRRKTQELGDLEL
jgi:hypothetical protein